jgi:hypothetical protein
MTKPVFQDLVDQQISVLRVISTIIVVFMSALLITLYTVWGIKLTLPGIIIPYIVGVFLNIISLPLHKKAFITYLVLIGITFIELIALSLVTGGILSPIVLIIVTLPGFAFYTSRKQGRIWFAICLLATVFLYRADYFSVTVSNIIPDNFRTLLYFIFFLFVLFLTSVYLLLVKQDVSKAHKAISNAAKDLEEKNKRMENLIMLVNYSTELMCVIDRNTLVFDEVNPVFKISLGYELAQLRGEPAKKILKDELLPMLAAVKDGEEARYESPVLCRNGEQKMISWQSIAKNGKLYTYGRNITK